MAVAPEEVREKARTVERQGKGLLVLINQLLDISKTKSSAGNPDWKNGNITAHLGMIIETCRDYARSRNIDLQFLPEGEIVMDSLLSNAFKFTPGHGTR